MSEPNGRPLKLLALDVEDLKVLSAHLQDAVVRIGDMIYLPSEKRFAAVLSRFDWVAAECCQGHGKPSLRRCRSAIRFDRVLKAQVHNLDLRTPSFVAELLAVTYDKTDPPGGYITMYFAGGAAVRLRVECIEAELRDLGAVWRAGCKPKHSVIEAG